jgi:hypothetical protein
VYYYLFFQPSIANATNIDTLLVATEKEDKMTAPPEALQDKIGFVFNNLSQLNLQTKVSCCCLVLDCVYVKQESVKNCLEICVCVRVRKRACV